MFCSLGGLVDLHCISAQKLSEDFLCYFPEYTVTGLDRRSAGSNSMLLNSIFLLVLWIVQELKPALKDFFSPLCKSFTNVITVLPEISSALDSMINLLHFQYWLWQEWFVYAVTWISLSKSDLSKLLFLHNTVCFIFDTCAVGKAIVNRVKTWVRR